MIKEFLKNVFFDTFKGIDVIVHKDEFKDIGSTGEQLTYRALWFYFKDKLFRNVYLKDENGKYTEIDLIGIGSKGGLYVFESKNYSGNIYCNGKYRNWIYYIGRKKYSFYSPILQNQRHINVLKHHFPEIPDENFHSVIIFSARCKLNMKNIPEDIYITKRDRDNNKDLHKTLKKIVSKNIETLSENNIKSICNYLDKHQRPEEEIKQEHLKNIKKK